MSSWLDADGTLGTVAANAGLVGFAGDEGTALFIADTAGEGGAGKFALADKLDFTFTP